MDQEVQRERKSTLIENLKLPLYEVINVEDQAAKPPSVQQQNLVGDLAYQCASFLNWVANPDNNTFLPESLWKNQMRLKASQIYPELDNDQIKKLVDRDWRVMNEEHQKKIISKYSKVMDQEQISNRITDMKSRLQAIRESMTNQQ